MYGTIWAAMLLFAAGETGKLRASASASWPWRAWTAGAVLCAVHMVIAIGVHHEWSHEHAVRETAARSAAVYGFGWSGGLYVNYVFLILWSGESLWWGADPVSYSRRHASVTWLLRIVYAIVIVNGVVIFASTAGRVVGVALSAWLAWLWCRPLPWSAHAHNEQRLPTRNAGITQGVHRG